MKDKYVLDSNIWIEIHRRNPAIQEKVEPLIRGNRVCLVDVIMAEVLRGARNPADFRVLKKAFSDFAQIRTKWEKVADLAFQVARRGFNPPLIDLYIAHAVLKNRRTLITLDRDFLQIAKVVPLSVEIWL